MKSENVGNGFLFCLVMALPFVSSEQLLDPGLTIRFLVIAGVCFLLGIYFLITLPKNKELKPLTNPVLVLMGIFVIYLAFRILPAFVFADALFDWLKIAIFFIFLWLVYQLFSANTICFSLSWSLAVLGFIISIWGLFSLLWIVSKDHFEFPFSTYDIKTVFEHRNLFAQALFLTLPFQLLKMVELRNRLFSLIFLSSSVISLFLLVILSSRAIWLAASISFLIAGITLFISRKQKAEVILNKLQVLKLLIVLFVGLLFALLFIRSQNSSPLLKSHSAEIFNPEKGTVKERFELWERSLALFKESPVFGKGLSNWKIEVLKYEHEGLVSEDNLTFYQRPHNDYLWILTETGLIGLLLYLFMIGLVLRSIFKSIFITDSKQVKLFYLTVLVAFTGYLIFSFFSFPRERIFHNLVFYMLIASVLVKYSGNETSGESTKRNLSGFLLAACLFLFVSASAIVVGIFRMNGEMQLKKSLYAKNERNYEAIAFHIKKAVNPFYQMDPTSTPLSWYSGFASFKLEKPLEAKGEFLKAYSLNPYHIHVLNNLGSAYFLLGESDSAIIFYLKAVKNAPNFDESWFNLTAVYFNMKAYDQAYESLKKVNLFTTDPRYKPFIKTIISKLILQEQEKYGLVSGNELPEDEEWYFEVHKKLRNEHKTLKNIIFEEQIQDLKPKSKRVK